jgi:hypothetical protein
MSNRTAPQTSVECWAPTRAARRAERLRLSDRPLLETGGLLRQTWRLAPCGELVERAARRKAGPAVEGWGGKQSALFGAQLCRGAGARYRAFRLTTSSNHDIGEARDARPNGRQQAPLTLNARPKALSSGGVT